MRIITASLLTVALLTASYCNVLAQPDTTDDENDLIGMLADETPKKEYTAATFKTTRIVNGHSIENTAKGVLDFRIGHRFGEIKSIKTFFGLDNANTMIGFDYGINDWIMVGVSRSTYEQEFEGLTKVRILRQRDTKGMPVSLSYAGAMSIQTMPPPPMAPGQEFFLSNRLFYANQLLVARKFSNIFSLQLMPTLIHYNLVPTKAESNNIMAIGAGGRLKLSNRISLNLEYFYRLDDAQLKGYHNSLSVGFDIETGGHVFQLMFTNADAMTQRAFVGQTVSDFTDGGIHFGFNISRVFTIVRPKGFENSRNKIW